jgi:hypothetical protein
VLNESDKIVNDQKEPANHLNNFFSTVDEKFGYNMSLLSEFFPIFVALTFCKLRI